MKFLPSSFSQRFMSNTLDVSKQNQIQLQTSLHTDIDFPKNLTSCEVTTLTPLDYEIVIASELKTETCQIKNNLRETIELQNTLINQITIIDQENLDSIEKHIDNSISNMQCANKNLDTSQNNVPSLVNPFKNIMNIVNLLTFWKKN